MFPGKQLFQPPGFQRGFDLLYAFAPLGFEFGVTLLTDKVEDRGQIISLSLELLKALHVPFDISLPPSDFGGVAGIIPKFRLGGFLLDFFEFCC